jgi:hypothetical protein
MPELEQIEAVRRAVEEIRQAFEKTAEEGVLSLWLLLHFYLGDRDAYSLLPGASLPSSMSSFMPSETLLEPYRDLSSTPSHVTLSRQVGGARPPRQSCRPRYRQARAPQMPLAHRRTTEENDRTRRNRLSRRRRNQAGQTGDRSRNTSHYGPGGRCKPQAAGELRACE